MKLVQRIQDGPTILREAMDIVNTILCDSDSLGEIFIQLAKEFCDSEDEADRVDVRRVVSFLMQPDRSVTVSIVPPKTGDYFSMVMSATNNVILVNRAELPWLEEIMENIPLQSKYFTFFFVCFLHECCHLFTRELNEIAYNSNSKMESAKYVTPEKVGRVTFDGATNKNSGSGLEMVLFGGIMLFEEGKLTITEVTDPNVDVENDGICRQYEIDDDLAVRFATTLRDWIYHRCPIAQVLELIHVRNLPIIINAPSSPKEVLKKKYLTKRSETTQRTGVARKLFCSVPPGYKS